MSFLTHGLITLLIIFALALSGCAATATFAGLLARKRRGTRQSNTSSSVWQGVFSAMTRKQPRSICDEIVMQVAQRR